VFSEAQGQLYLSQLCVTIILYLSLPTLLSTCDLPACLHMCISANTLQDLAIRVRESGCYSNSIVPPGALGERRFIEYKNAGFIATAKQKTCDKRFCKQFNTNPSSIPV
jgi:hypothetical protein